MEALWAGLGLIIGTIITLLILKGRHASRLHTLQLEQADLKKDKEWLEGEKKRLEQRERDLQAQVEQVRTELQAKVDKAQKDCTEATTNLTTLKDEHDKWKKTLEKQWQEQFEAFQLKSLNTIRTQFEDDINKTAKEKEEAFQKEMKTLVEPLSEMVGKFGKQNIEISDRIQQLNIAKSQLVSALTLNKGRGDWGEVELIRLLEDCNMKENLHYEKQLVVGESNKRVDICVKLPDQRHIFIDAKTLQFDLQDVEFCEDPLMEEQRQSRCIQSLKQAIKTLHEKAYHDEMQKAADFVVLYVPREWMYTIALEKEPKIFKDAYNKNVLLAGPFNLLGLLRIVMHGWYQAEMSDNAKKILEAGKVLHERAALFEKRFHDLGKTLGKLNDNYSDVRKSFDGPRGFVKQFKKLEDYHAKSSKGELLEEIYQPDNLPGIPTITMIESLEDSALEELNGTSAIETDLPS